MPLSRCSAPLVDFQRGPLLASWLSTFIIGAWKFRLDPDCKPAPLPLPLPLTPVSRTIRLLVALLSTTGHEHLAEVMLAYP